MNRLLLALDFDGVLCDSSPECAIVSANARLALADPGHTPCFTRDVAPPDSLERFFRFRYLVRTAPQYLLLWDLVGAGGTIHPTHPLESQTPADPGRLAAFEALFFSLRGRWRSEAYDVWLDYNPLQPAVETSLRDLARLPDLRIVSAKDEPSIRAILARYGVPLGPGQVLGREYGDKRELLARLLQEFPDREIRFVDDNLDNLALAALPGVRCLLADWGYVGPDWAQQAQAAGFTVLSPQGFTALVREALP